MTKHQQKLQILINNFHNHFWKNRRSGKKLKNIFYHHHAPPPKKKQIKNKNFDFEAPVIKWYIILQYYRNILVKSDLLQRQIRTKWFGIILEKFYWCLLQRTVDIKLDIDSYDHFWCAYWIQNKIKEKQCYKAFWSRNVIFHAFLLIKFLKNI